MCKAGVSKLGAELLGGQSPVVFTGGNPGFWGEG